MGNGGLFMFLTLGGFALFLWWRVRRNTGVNKRNVRREQRSIRYNDKQAEIYRLARAAEDARNPPPPPETGLPDPRV